MFQRQSEESSSFDEPCLLGNNEKETKEKDDDLGILGIVNRFSRKLSSPLMAKPKGQLQATCSAPSLSTYNELCSLNDDEETRTFKTFAKSHSIQSPWLSTYNFRMDSEEKENMRLVRFGKLLSGPSTDLYELRKFSWNGIPEELRGKTWRLLSGYLPVSIDRRKETLHTKQTQYHNFVQQYYPTRLEALHEETFRQIHVDIPRTNPLIPFFQQEVVQHMFERVLFIWAIRHPACGYVQGINDLVVPFFMVFLSEFIDTKVKDYNISDVPQALLDIVEADTFWCFSKLLDGIQNNYTFAQPGIQIKVNKLKELMSRINEPLNNHLRKYKIDYLFFAFRWMNNLLMRELPLNVSIRLWDTYWSEPDGFAIFHLYVCAALLKRFADDIMSKNNFQSLMTFLQNLPCKDFTEDDISRLLSEAYQLKFMFDDAPGHLSHS